MGDTTSRIFKIIEFLAEAGDWVSLRTMARELHLNAASAYRALNSLKELGYVRQDPQDSRYQLSLKIAWVSAQLLENVQLRQIAHPQLQRLTSVTNETTHLAILEGNEFVYIDKVDNTQAMRMRSRVGQRGQLYSTAAGKSILSFLPDTEKEKLVRGMKLTPFTKNTISELGEFRDELEHVHHLGYAVDDEENEVGIRCIGSPIFDHAGRVAGALSISGWTITMTRERIPQLAPELLRSCQEISRELGYGGEINGYKKVPANKVRTK
jgi:IclR family acetate operon transcriptional repressor